MAKKEREKFPGEAILAATAEKVETIGNKTYYVVKSSDPIWKIFEEGYKNSEFYALCKEGGAKFKIQFVYPMVGKNVAARICRANPNLKIHAGIDYVIEISGEFWEMMDDATREILMAHELNHINASMNDEGKVSLDLRDHDVKDFRWIIKKYGVEWCELQAKIFESIADNREQEKLRNKTDKEQRAAGRAGRKGKQE